MNLTINFQKIIVIFGIPLFLIGLIVLTIYSPMFVKNPNELSFGLTIDLLLTVPFVYFLLIRKTKIPKTTVVPLCIIGLIIGSFIIPSEHQHYLNLFKNWILPIIELTVITFIIFKIRKAIKQFKINKTKSFDFFTTLKNTCNDILPKNIVIPFATEIAVFYFGFIYWKKRELKENEFSYHKNSGTITLLIALIFIIAIETFVFHMVLLKWSNTAAWILTILSIYSGIQILGFLKSMLKRPISIEQNQLLLRYGIMSETTINLTDIETVEISSKDIKENKDTRKLSILGEMESHNIIIKLKKENTLLGLYGIKRKYKNIALYLDKKDEFKNRINTLIEKHKIV